MENQFLSWLERTSVFSVDIETETDPQKSYPEILHSVKKFGLSALAPITDVGLYSPELGSLYLNMRGFNPYTKTLTDEALLNWQFLYNLICRPNITFVNHNAVFDLRGLGVQYNAMVNQLFEAKENRDLRKYWKLPLGSKVWDTAIIAKRMLLGEQHSKKSPFADKFDLLHLAQRLGIEKDPKLAAMIEWMKGQRANLSGLAETLRELPSEHEVWAYLGGRVPPNRPDLLEGAARQLIADYVADDARVAFQVYEKQLEIAKILQTQDYTLGKFKLAKYPELLGNDVLPQFKGHLDFWTRALRTNANRAVHGLRLNRRYLKERRAEFKSLVKKNEALVMGAKDPHEPYENFEEIASQFVYFEMLLDKFQSSSSTYNQNIGEEWVFWKPVEVYPPLLREALDFHESLSENDIKAWMQFLRSEPYAKFTDAKKAAPKTHAPKLNLEAWIKRNCYADYSEPLASLLAKSKADWLRTFYTTRRYDLKKLAEKYWKEHPLKSPEIITEDHIREVGTREFYRKMTNSKKWIPYYIYCVAGAPLPSSEALKFSDGLTTASLKRKVEEYKKSNAGVEPEDYQLFVVNCHLHQQAFSYGKNAISFFLEDPDYEESLKPLRDLIQYRAYLTRFAEIEQHAALDNHVHSLILPDAKTTRGASTNPNLQNVAMNTKDKKYPSPYPGIFIAPKGKHFVSIDYSNAEVKMGNMIARDDAGAKAAEDNDYHAAMAETYWPALWNAVNADRKAIRSASKSITFSIPYGAGVYKVARMMRAGVKEARELLDNRKRLLWRTEEQKKVIEENARKRMRMGYLPVFAQLWSRERVQVDRNQFDIIGYPTWNYLQQGGVTAMIRRADVLLTEMLEAGRYKTFVQQDIHDELLIAFDLDEYMANDRELPRKILEIMNNIVPETYLERTTPKTHFIAEIGPENAKKWGYHPYVAYPFPMDEFISQWGRHELPEGEAEAPSWPGPKHLGWTLEKETEALQAKRLAQAAMDTEDVGTIELGQEWYELQELLCDLDLAGLAPEQRKLALAILKPMELVYEDKDGKVQRSGALSFPAWMIASRSLYHRGKPTAYRDFLSKIKMTLESLNGQAEPWLSKHQSVFEVLK